MKEIEGINYYPPIEEKINIISHATGLILSIVALVLLVTRASLHGSVWQIVSFAIFGVSLITLYAASTSYHAAKRSGIKYLGSNDEFTAISVGNVDAEIAEVAGPQLVVPVSNSRFAINAANARWGSLYDALYGSDVISEDKGQERGSGYNATRGAAVIREHEP